MKRDQEDLTELAAISEEDEEESKENFNLKFIDAQKVTFSPDTHKIGKSKAYSISIDDKRQ